MLLRDVVDEALRDDPLITAAVREDLLAIARAIRLRLLRYRVLYYKGFQCAAGASHRALAVAARQELDWPTCCRTAPLRVRRGHPSRGGARKGIMIVRHRHRDRRDCVVGDNVSMLHGVTLGARLWQRRPSSEKWARRAARSRRAGARTVRIGDGARIGAGSLVLADVPVHATVAGVPARVVGAPCNTSRRWTWTSASRRRKKPATRSEADGSGRAFFLFVLEAGDGLEDFRARLVARFPALTFTTCLFRDSLVVLEEVHDLLHQQLGQVAHFLTSS